MHPVVCQSDLFTHRILTLVLEKKKTFKMNRRDFHGPADPIQTPSNNSLKDGTIDTNHPPFYCLIGNLFEVYRPGGVGIEKRNMNDDCLSNVIFMCLMSVSMLPIAGLAFPLILCVHLPSPMYVDANFRISQMRKLLGGTCVFTCNLSPIPNSPI